MAALAPGGALAASNAKDKAIVGASDPDRIPGSYIVVFKDAAVRAKGVTSLTRTAAAKSDAKVKHKYTSALHGFAATMSKAEAERLAADPAVAYVAQNQTVHALADQAGPPSWGLDRADQRNLPLNGNYHYDTTASNVTAYVIDTGILTTHQTFGGRAVWGTNTVDTNNTDCNGHGTHVAGTVGGSQYGIAKGVRLVAVKVLNCAGSGTSAGVAAGVDWVTGNHAAGTPAVANMSLGGGADSVIDTAVRNSIADGVTYAIASGNSSANACNYSPARVAEAITVDASDSNDARASFSNFGTCTDIFAPGVGITSAWIGAGNTATNTISGTSMATPHVTGAAALYLAANPTATPAAVQAALKANATTGKITNAGSGSPNALLMVGNGTTPPPPPPASCTGTNGTDVAIPDAGAAVTSPIAIAGCSKSAGSATATVEVHIVHTWIGDLVVDLVAPDGSVYNLHNRGGGSADNINQVYTVNLSSEQPNGTWTLRARDAAAIDVGRIDSWTLTL